MVVSMTPSTSTFEMIKKYNTSNKYEFVQDGYIQIEAPLNMFPDMYLFGSIDGKEPEILGIIINCYACNENDIDFQVEMIKENEVKLISCQVEYTNFRPDLIEASSTNSTNTIKNSMFKLDNYESLFKSGLTSCADLLKRIATVLRYRYVRSKKTSYVLLHLQQKGKFLDKIDSQLLALRRVYLFDLEENITKSDFNLTIEFQKTRKVEFETTITLQTNVMRFMKPSSIAIYFQTPLIQKWLSKDVKKPPKCSN